MQMLSFHLVFTCSLDFHAVGICPISENMDDTQQKQLMEATLLLKFQQNMGMLPPYFYCGNVGIMMGPFSI